MELYETVKTAAGKALPVMSFKGKPYLEVKYRIVWFREDHPDWSIETSLEAAIEPNSTLFKATIKDQAGRIISTAHKFENKAGFADHLEKAETGAIGRALALIGYGTQFTDELDEGDKPVDAPTTPKIQKKTSPPAPNVSKPVIPLPATPKPWKLTPAEIQAMALRAKECNYSSETAKVTMEFRYKVKQSADLTLEQYEDFMAYMKANPVKKV